MTDSAANRLLIAAASAADWDRVLALATAGADLQAAADDDGASLLHLALYQNRFAIAGVLLAHGLSATAPDFFGRTPLHYLAETADPAQASVAADLLPALTAHGADPNAADSRGRTPLHAAAVHGLPELLAALLAAGAAVDTAKRDGQTPLHLAVTRHRLAAAHLLLQHGADPDRPAHDGRSPRDLARTFADDDLLAAFNRSR